MLKHAEKDPATNAVEGKSIIMKERDSSLDAVKGFAILLVMLGHCLVWNNLSATDPYCYDFIKAVQMPLFMMISGYLAGMGMKERTLAQTGSLLLKRAAAYLIPFFVWPVLLHPFHPIQEVEGILWQLDKGLWFLGILFLVMMLTLLAQWLAFGIVREQPASKGQEKKRVWMRMVVFLGIMFLFFVLFFLQGRSGNTFWSPGLTVTYLPYYVAGYLLTAFLKRLELWSVSRRITGVLWGSAAVVFVSLIILCDLQKTESLKDIAIQFAAGLTGCFVCFYSVYRIKSGRFKELLAKAGTVTLELYIFQYAMHAPFVHLRNLGETQYSLYCPQGVVTVLGTFFLMCAVSLPGIYLIRKIPLLDGVLFGHINRLKKE